MHSTASFARMILLATMATSYSHARGANSETASHRQRIDESADLLEFPAVRIIDKHGLHDGIVKHRPDMARIGTFWTIGSTYNSSLDEGAGIVGEGPRLAIIAPLKRLMPQALNLSCFDTYIAGEININSLSDVTVLVPRSSGVDIGDVSQINIVEFDEESVHQAVEAYLAKHFSRYILDFQGNNRIAKAIDKSGRDISLYENFRPLLETHKHISYGWTDGATGGFLPMIFAAEEIARSHRITSSDTINRYEASGLAPIALHLDSVFRSLDGQIDRKVIQTVLDLNQMAIEKLKNVDFDMLSAEEFRSLPLNQPLDIIESIGKYIGDLDPEKLYPSSHWANPYVEIIILIRDHSKKMNLLPSAPNPPMFSCPFDSEIEAAFNQ